MSADKPFTRENLDSCLKELAKEFDLGCSYEMDVPNVSRPEA